MNLGKLLERLFQLIPVMLGVSAIVFLMMLVTPGDPVDIMLGEQQATTEQREALRKDMGLDLPAAQRFVHFLQNAAVGNFGYSYFHRRPVSEVILERLPATVELTVAA
ncbi:MAG: ABC transporter permease, partial [Rhodoferax sp.]